MKPTSATRIFAVRIFAVAALGWSGLALAPIAHAQTASGQQRTHGINAPGTNIGPSPGVGTPDPFLDAQNGGINAKSPSAGAGQVTDSGTSASGGTSDNAPRSEVSGTAQTENQNTSGIWPFAIPIAAIVIGVPLAGMLWMRRSKSKREN